MLYKNFLIYFELILLLFLYIVDNWT